MGKIVNHDERRREILHKALKLFSNIGYQQATYQQLADACGLSRTALYKYFENKKDIFDSAIYLLVQENQLKVNKTVEENPGLKASEKLELVLLQSVDLCLSNPALLQTIIEYLIAQRRQGESVERKIRRHTVGLRCTIKNLLQEGIATGEFGATFSTMVVTDMLFNQILAIAMRIMFYDETEREQLIKHCQVIIQALKRTGGVLK